MSAKDLFQGKLVMAPMSRGTDLPFRRLVNEWGAETCVGEMAYAHKILRDKNESVLLRRHPSEKTFGVQLAGKKASVMADAARRAEECGANFVDVNLGCPIDDATRRGFGAALLRRQARVADIVAAMKRAVSIPVTIKMRLGWSNEKPTYLKIARAAEDAGVDAMSLHARSRAQRYRRPADWDRVAELVDHVKVPVIGNGDILTWRDAKRRMEETGCAGVMIGRWALTKPWIFREFAEERDIEPDVDERLAIISRYIDLCREHFGDDGKGRQRTRRFLVFHQDFFRRYRKGASSLAINSSDPRDWGGAPEGKLEQWLSRGDEDAVEALADWLIDGKDPAPPGEGTGAPRAVKVEAYG